jgi:hypothetical protein
VRKACEKTVFKAWSIRSSGLAVTVKYVAFALVEETGGGSFVTAWSKLAREVGCSDRVDNVIPWLERAGTYRGNPQLWLVCGELV